jgi:hypothetical protein
MVSELTERAPPVRRSSASPKSACTLSREAATVGRGIEGLVALPSEK